MKFKELSKTLMPMSEKEGVAYVKERELDIEGPVPVIEFLWLVIYAKKVRVR